ncbi:hypothetical protein MY04_3143 [Flammeovirga sp. MY04]|uniref:hypothetical protein n=1 Tax=Flammeovirga sp. MY04 TaxID=1191459 RepID=UPI0008061CF3|nr:hypothetical protein [Flammeovirga sp. MY04]ANQ50508.1 hypothetical protein MY04_3143 [Flammeovirga sp. MY04]
MSTKLLLLIGALFIIASTFIKVQFGADTIVTVLKFIGLFFIVGSFVKILIQNIKK